MDLEGNRSPVGIVDHSAVIQPNHRVDVDRNVDRELQLAGMAQKCHHASMVHKVLCLAHRKRWDQDTGMEVAKTLVGLEHSIVGVCCTVAGASDSGRSPLREKRWAAVDLVVEQSHQHRLSTKATGGYGVVVADAVEKSTCC